MRNLKRALSLTLASIMLLGMMVVGSSAASYQDVTDEHNVEAIEVLQAVGIMVGDEGNFNPEKNVTRNEMAVIMSNLMDYRVATYAGTSPFTDVPSWAEPYVAACYTNGITSGTSATTYNGSGNVTTAQAALMVMKALGYFQYATDFKDDWQLATTRQANNIDLLVDVKAGVKEAMTRNDVAQLVLNGLEAGTVEADDNTINVSANGATVQAGDVKYDFVTSTRDYAFSINGNASTTNYTDASASVVELGEKLYQGSLTKSDADGYINGAGVWTAGYRDAFERPANHWEYQGKEIGTYTKAENFTFTKKVTTKTLYNAVGSAACDYTWYVSVDGDRQGSADFGKLVNTNKTDDNNCFLQECVGAAGALRTGNGTLTQVFVNGVRGTVHVSVIHYFPAEVLRINDADTNRSITLSNLDNDNGMTTKDVFETEEFEDGDIVAYSYSKKSSAIEEVYATERLEGKVTQARAYESLTDENAKEGDHFTVDETKYNYNKTVSAAAPRRLTTENVNNNMVGYLDQYGYVIYIDDAAATYDYAYVLTMGSRDDEFGGLTTTRAADGKTWYARLVLTDGTVVKAETDAKDNSLLHCLVSYSVDSKGVYSLRGQSTEIGNKTLKITNGAAGIRVNNETFTANADTVFIVADSDAESADDYNFRVYTGIKNVPDIENWSSGKTTWSVAAKGANGIAKVVYVQDADVSGTKNVIFIESNEGAKFDKSTGSSRNYVINAVEDGETVTLLVKENSEAARKLVNSVDKEHGYAKVDGKVGIVAAEYLTRDTDGIVTNVKLYDEALNSDGDGYMVATGSLRAERQTVGLGTERKGYSDSTIVVRYDVKSGNFYPETSLNGIKDDKDDVVLGILDTGTLTGICYLNTTSGAGEKPSGSGGGDTPVPPVENKGNVKPATGEPVVMDGDTYGSLSVDRLGNLSLNVKFKAPAWAEGVNATGEVSFDVTIKDDQGTVKTLTGKTGTLNDGVYKYDAIASELNDVKNAIAAGTIDASKLEVTFSNVKWTNAVVEYQYADGTDASKELTAGYPTSLKVSTTTTESFSFTFTKKSTQTVSKDAKWTISGVNVAANTEKTGELKSGTAVTALSGKVAATGGTKVIVELSGVTKAEVVGAHSVESNTTGVKALEFYLITAASVTAGEATVPGTATAVEALTGTWTKSVPAASEGDTILIRAASGDQISSSGLTSSDFLNKDTLKAATGITPNDIAGGTSANKYWKFTMGKENLVIIDVDVDTPVIQKVSIAPDGSQVNVKMASGTYTASSTQTAKYVKAQAVADYINANSAALGGWTAEVKTNGFEAGTGKAEADGITLSKGGSSKDVTDSTMKVNASLPLITVDGDEYVANAAITGAAGGLTLANALGIAGVTIADADDHVYVIANKNAVGTYTAGANIVGMATGSTGMSGFVASGVKEIVTNDAKGYAKMADPALVAIPDSGADGQVAGNKPNLDFANASKTLIMNDDTNDYCPIGVELTIVAKFGVVAADTFTGGVKLVADGTQTGMSVTYGTSTTIAANAATTADTTITISATIQGGASKPTDDACAFKLKTANLA